MSRMVTLPHSAPREATEGGEMHVAYIGVMRRQLSTWPEPGQKRCGSRFETA